MTCHCDEADGQCTYLAADDNEDELCDECAMGNHEGHEEE